MSTTLPPPEPDLSPATVRTSGGRTTARVALAVLAFLGLPGLCLAAVITGGAPLLLVAASLHIGVTASAVRTLGEPLRGASVFFGLLLGALSGFGLLCLAFVIGIAAEVVPFLAAIHHPYEDAWMTRAGALAVVTALAVLGLVTLGRPRRVVVAAGR